MNYENETLEKIREQIVACIDEYNAALHEGKLDKMNESEVALKNKEKEYATEVAKVVYTNCLASTNPMRTAVETYSYPIVTHRDEKEDGVVVRRVIDEEKTRQVDLLKFCEYSQKIKAENKLSTDWQHYVAKLNQLLCMRAARDLKFTAAQVKQIASTFYMKEFARKIELGETPDSNTQLCKELQIVIDKILFEDDGKGKNKIKANSHDVAYLTMLYAKKGKHALSVQVAKDDFLRRLITDILYRIVMDKKYSLEYREVKSK